MAVDADTGRLDAALDAPAYATKLRWSGPQLIAAASEKVPGANVRALPVPAPMPTKAEAPSKSMSVRQPGSVSLSGTACCRLRGLH
ncbi:hypothetical protein [Streptomyces canus]|uniref:hypothetical protein n=1 Tax=Streptomyces canus TaxID=58343 RepID=UPI002E28E087|nr:hypothetical protein [Streptomyces canus]